jgi:LPS-assembly protein
MRQRPPLTPASAMQPSAPLGAIACAVLVLCCAHPWANAQTAVPSPIAPNAPLAQPGNAEGNPVRLQTSPLLQEKFSDDVLRQQPTFVFGDRVTGRPDLETVIEGSAELRRSGAVVRADRIEYYQPDDEAKARGNVRINRDGNVYQGKEAQIKLESSEGFFIDPTYQFLKNGGHGEASRIDFIDNKRSIARDATYTTCTRRPGPSWMPDWVVKASQVSFDTENDVGVAIGAQLLFKDVPILALPYLSFPMSDTRKSGWLPPALNIDNTSGVEVMAPYYWNIAPNRDATFFPSVATKRGLNVGGEFRYLEKDYSGRARLDWSPYDRLRGTSRWGLATSHSGTIDTGVAAVGAVALNLSLNRVSDDNYWSDFPRATGTLTQRLLANDAGLSWSQGPFSVNTRVLKWQTLQIPSAIIIPPYDRLPQVTGRYARSNVAGLDISTELDFTQFRSQQALTLQPNAQRTYALAQVSRPWTAPGYFFTPKVQFHVTDYKFDSALLATGDTRAQRVVPTTSLDTGLIYERDTQYFGRKFTQTLEPRAFSPTPRFAIRQTCLITTAARTTLTLPPFIQKTPLWATTGLPIITC